MTLRLREHLQTGQAASRFGLTDATAHNINHPDETPGAGHLHQKKERQPWQ
jgi:hypothetical protein